LNCVHCPIPNKQEEPRALEDILTEINESDGKFQIQGCVLCHPNWKKIIEHAHNVAGHKITICSNTTHLIDPKNAEIVAKHVDKIHIPVFGSTAYTYLAITDTPGTYEAYEAGILNARMYGITLIPHVVMSMFITMDEGEVAAEWMFEHFTESPEIHLHIVNPLKVVEIVKQRRNYPKLRSRVHSFDTDFTDIEWFVALLRKYLRQKIYIHNAPLCVFHSIPDVAIVQTENHVYTDVCEKCAMKGICRGVPQWSSEKPLPIYAIKQQ